MAKERGKADIFIIYEASNSPAVIRIITRWWNYKVARDSGMRRSNCHLFLAKSIRLNARDTILRARSNPRWTINRYVLTGTFPFSYAALVLARDDNTVGRWKRNVESGRLHRKRETNVDMVRFMERKRREWREEACLDARLFQPENSLLDYSTRRILF